MPKRWFPYIVISRIHLIIFLTLIITIIAITLVISVPTTTNPNTTILQGKIIAIDAGHGGIDAGSAHAGWLEKDITLMLSKVIAEEIERQGGIPILTRNEDHDLWDQVSIQDEIQMTKQEYEQDLLLGLPIDARDRTIALGTRTPPTYRLGLRARLLRAKESQASIMLSIHTNHYRSESAKGAVTLYQPHFPESQNLAIAIQKHLNVLLPGRSAPGIVADNFFILRRSTVPTVLIEIGFISNTRDREFMLSDEGQSAIAKAVINGIIDYYSGIAHPAAISYNGI